jgi:TonB family protein
VALRDKDRTNLKYAASIGLSAVAHAVFLYLVLFALPQWLKTDETPPPAYTVTIVDNLPAGDLGTHPLPVFKHRKLHPIGEPPPEHKSAEQQEKPEEREPNSAKIDAPDTNRNAIALNAHPTEAPTPEPTATPTPAPVETPEPTAEPTTEPTQRPTAEPSHRPRPTIRPQPTPRPRPEALREHHRHKSPAPRFTPPRVMLARATPKAARTPSVRERLAKLREQLMKEHLQQMAKAEKARAADASDEDAGDETDTGARTASRETARGGGPVVGTSATGGHGYGVGSGTGSLGMLRDPEFLLYYQKVQERIKNAWTYGAGNKDLTTTVTFAIAPDGKLTALEVTHSSNNLAFDQSVMRAIRGAAPFPPPPEHYRDQFAQGVQAVFKLGELSS